jgi:uncharacterized protein
MIEDVRTIQSHVKVNEFAPERYEKGRKHRLLLDLGAFAGDISLPVLLVRGSIEGETLVVTAGVHGDEFEGVRAVLEVFDELNPDTLTGSILMVPVANPPAFWSGSRTSPVDGGNLARSFPGREKGTQTGALAFHLGESILARSDFYLDLHTAGVKLSMPCMVGYDSSDARSSAAAFAFGAPVIWGHPRISPGRTISFAAERGIPWLYTEGSGAGRIDLFDLAIFKNGIFNLMRHLKMVPGKPVAGSILHSLSGEGDLDASIEANTRGFLVSNVELLDRVVPGTELGRTIDLTGKTVEVFTAAQEGVVGMIHAFPIVEPGDTLFLITGSNS